MYRRNTIKWSLSCDKGKKTREEVFKKLDYGEFENKDELTKNTSWVANLTIVLPIVILFCTCGTVVANECRVNPYADNTRRILTSVGIYTGAFLGILGLIVYISFIGMKAYEDYELTA
jgi:hypothetical protein